ncbi:hypothetical protein [Arthrobacter sp. ISL-65]|uniref:hypothetical protein n=1 Tax=Arthrobacter sp. ISL-65 TaxID=2819112 RepID=UPI001BEAC7C4|nr:hypothetical protein [Arthrobacter sp. ISL-65]
MASPHATTSARRLGPVRTGLKNVGAYRQYQRAFVLYSPATGTQVSRAAIRTAYGAGLRCLV